MDKGNSIILTGFMGSGKTSLGKAVSKKLQLPFLDTDRLIVDREGISINEIVAEKGEAYFRELETRTIQELIDREGDYVLSVGGGLPMKAENRPILKQAGGRNSQGADRTDPEGERTAVYGSGRQSDCE